ncbi:MAG: LysR family transcriptional regulator substrate-binding protein, partial [Synergistaceae bacterium]|nr:LysR family transcriptional regulator substrate-binding protein [Synergistaceae bacterium]
GHDEKALLERIRHGVDLVNLAQMPWVTFTKPNYLRMYLDEFFETRGLHPHIICETSRHDLALRFCEQGYGVGIIYQMLLYDMLQNRDASGIYIFPVKNAFPKRYTNLVYRKESFKPSYFMSFLEITRNVFHEYAENIKTLIETER